MPTPTSAPRRASQPPTQPVAPTTGPTRYSGSQDDATGDRRDLVLDLCERAIIATSRSVANGCLRGARMHLVSLGSAAHGDLWRSYRHAEREVAALWLLAPTD